MGRFKEPKIKLLKSDHWDERAPGVAIDTVIIHSMYAPEANEPFSAEACFELLNQHQVSAHYLIDKSGAIVRLVPNDKRAWHAGVSQMPPPDLREGVNHFSIGIELIGDPMADFTDLQYDSLVFLVDQLATEYTISAVLGHEHVAQPPGRKRDPGERFDWPRFLSKLNTKHRLSTPLTI